ncbi:MAG: hypothetical protein MdMp014T_2778 [Treponematales bacterium]
MRGKQGTGKEREVYWKLHGFRRSLQFPPRAIMRGKSLPGAYALAMQVIVAPHPFNGGHPRNAPASSPCRQPAGRVFVPELVPENLTRAPGNNIGATRQTGYRPFAESKG